MEPTLKMKRMAIKNSLMTIEGLLEDLAGGRYSDWDCSVEISDRAYSCLMDYYKIRRELLCRLTEV